MADENKTFTTSSGVWRLDDTLRPAARGRPAVTATPSRGLPAAPRDRATVLLELARADVAKGNLISAETNYRLALTFMPANPKIQAELKAVIDKREDQRRTTTSSPSGLRIR